MAKRSAKREASMAVASPRRRATAWLALNAALIALALGVNAPALRGPFVSDDVHYLVANPWIQSLGAENLLAIWNPRSPLPALVENYAPVHLTLHGVAWAVFGALPLGHHVLNAVVHAVAASLLVALWCRMGVAFGLAIGAGVLFVAHPANIEAVAWISQLKSPVSLALALAALLLHPVRPLVALLCFSAALLAKPTIAFAWPLVALLRGLETHALAGDAAPAGRRGEWLWLAGWGLALALFAVAELSAFSGAAGHLAPLHPDPIVRARTIVSLVGRYGWMSASGLGTSAFHEPPIAASWLDPFWLAGATLLAFGALRTLGVATLLCRLRPTLSDVGFSSALRWRLREALGWVWALAAFVPVSQIFPFQFPLADRYLYTILPGLLLVVLCVISSRCARARTPWPQRGLAGVAALVAVAFIATARGRAAVWSSPERVVADAALHYPDGISAHQLRARRAVQQGDRAGALEALRAMHARGEVRYEALLADPAYATLRDDPDFRALVSEMAGFWIERTSRRPDPGQIELLTRGRAHVARRELEAAIADFERAQALPGPMRDVAARELSSLRARRAAQRSVVSP